MTTDAEQKVYESLEKLSITWVVRRHPPVFTVEEAEKHWEGIEGAHCKNLFLRNKKGSHHYLVILEHSKMADMRVLARKLGEDRLSFASPERLMRCLGLETGSVSPFGLINDRNKEVRVVIDGSLKGASKVNFHPNVNTATVGINFADFIRFLNWCGNEVRYIDLPPPF